MIVVISGPGGVGKGTVVERLLERDDRLWLSRSWTTRPRREGEDPEAYEFVDRSAFEERIRAGGFWEWAEFLGNLYGTPVPEAHPDRDVVLEIDVQGARQVLEHQPGALLVFVDVADEATQRSRMRSRGDDPDQIERRVARAAEERREATELGAVWVINDDLERATAELAGIIEAARSS